jgi:hypothetical protein
LENDTEWRVLWRNIALPVYEGWTEIEREVAAKKGITIPEDKRSSAACASYTALYECMLQHFRQMTDQEWKNF